MKFAQAGLVVGEIAKAEGGDNQVKRCGAQRKMQRVGLERDRAAPAELACSAGEHAVRKIRGDDGSRACGPMFQQRHGHVAGAATDVEHGRIGI